MQERGIELMYGRWLIEGAPRVLLINTGTGYRWLDEWKADLWSAAAIPSPSGDHETNEAIVFGYLVAWFLGEVRLDIHHTGPELMIPSVHRP
jgi:glycogen(starch) synthase